MPVVGFNNGIFTDVPQPCFSAYKSALSANVTGDGTNYTILFDTVDFDIAGNYNSGTGTFTAGASPAVQYWLFYFSVEITTVNAGSTSLVATIVTTGGNHVIAACNPTIVAQTTNTWQFTGSVIAPMNAGDTAICRLQVSNGTLSTTVSGNNGRVTAFQGRLLG